MGEERDWDEGGVVDGCGDEGGHCGGLGGLEGGCGGGGGVGWDVGCVNSFERGVVGIHGNGIVLIAQQFREIWALGINQGY